MGDKSFSIKEALSVGWRKSWDQARFLFGLFLIWIGYIVVLAIINSLFKDIYILSTVVIFVESVFMGSLFTVGIMKIYYDIYTFDNSSYKQLYKSAKYLITYLFASFKAAVLLFGWLIVSGGVIFTAMLIISRFDIILRSNPPLRDFVIASGMAIPCAIVAFNILAMFLFIPITIVSDDASGVSAALKMSRAISKGHRIKLLLFGLLTILLVAISFGFLTSVVGIAWMHVYKKLKNLHT